MDARILDERPMNLASGLSAAPRRHPRLARQEP
jgi:hypothetical protein